MTAAIQGWSRRTFLSATTLASLSATVPVSATMLRGEPGLAILSASHMRPPSWAGPSLVLSGDLRQRLGQLREGLERHRPRQVRLFLDDADQVLFDIVTRDLKAGVQTAEDGQGLALRLNHRPVAEGKSA
jgi:hypothetical protein